MTFFRSTVRRFTPAFAKRFARSLLQRFGPSRWEVAPRGWDTPQRGWDIASIASVQKERWPSYASAIAGTAPLTIPHEHDRGHVVTIGGHNAAMAFAFVVATAAHAKQRLRILDWGGGVGHYALLTRAAVPGLEVEYVVYDMPQISEAGPDLIPEVTFVSNRDAALRGTYDLVVASSSLWYDREWRRAVDDLVNVCGGYLFITRMGIVRRVPSYVAIQRPVEARYDTEYLCWILNEQELVSYVRSKGLHLLREFLIDHGPMIRNAPEQPMMRGYLFGRSE